MFEGVYNFSIYFNLNFIYFKIKVLEDCKRLKFLKGIYICINVEGVKSLDIWIFIKFFVERRLGFILYEFFRECKLYLKIVWINKKWCKIIF